MYIYMLLMQVHIRSDTHPDRCTHAHTHTHRHNVHTRKRTYICIYTYTYTLYVMNRETKVLLVLLG